MESSGPAQAVPIAPQAAPQQFDVSFWGVRGSVPVPGVQTSRVGGNTSCVEILCDGTRLVIDAGTGLRALGEALKLRAVQPMSLLMTHMHWDHVQGLPFFRNAYMPGQIIDVYAEPRGGVPFREIVRRQMSQPTFPVGPDEFRAELTYRDIASGDRFTIGPAEISTACLNHPGGSTGYRIEHAGFSMAHISDWEHPGLRDAAHPDAMDAAIVRFAAGVDLLVIDSQFTEHEYHNVPRRGWGHATWEASLRHGIEAGAKRIALFHHEPTHDDDVLEQIEADAKARFAGAFLAREGLVIAL